jgi:acyl-coenzyme A synthetase/AMP-(fatty) acid ligase
MTRSFSSGELSGFLARTVDISFEPLVERPHDELAEQWRSLGLRPGDLVLLSVPTSGALLRHFFAVLDAGGVPALIAPGTRSVRLRELAKAMGARAIACAALPTGDLGTSRVEKVGLLEVALFEPSAEPSTREGDVVMLTSGTSGAASGCVTSLDAMIRNGVRHADAIGQRPSDTVLVSLPLHFSFAMVAQALGTMARGGRLVIAGPPFMADRYAHSLEVNEVDVTALAPTQVRTLLTQGKRLPSSLRVLSVGGDSLAPEHVADLLRARPGGELYLTYGLTQAGPRVSTLAAHAEPASRFASVGLPLDGTQVEVEPLGDDSGRTQLIVTSDTVMRRRIGNVEGRSADELRAPGVLATGDLFDRDQDGYLFYRGRLTEYIQRGGEKVCIATIRRLATSIPGVVTARTPVAVTADGEDYDLWLVMADGVATPTAAECRTLLAHATRRADLPRAIEIVSPNDPRLGHK